MPEHHPAIPLLKSVFSLPRGAKESNNLHMYGTHTHVNTRPNSSAKLNPERAHCKKRVKIKKRSYYVLHSGCYVQIGFFCVFRDFACCTHMRV